MQLIGRDADVTEVVARLRERRLVTVTGPGGIGKTALANAAAAIVGAEFPYGTITVDLTRVDQPEGVFEAIAGQLGYADFDSLMNSPSDQPALIVIDNCEHVLDAAADATQRMLDACKMPTLLTTSRSPLDLPGESVVALGPLPTPGIGLGDEAAALTLLRERMRDAGADPDACELDALAEICRRLDGVPLAIELAAARLRAHAPHDLLAELDERPHALARRRFRGQPSHRSVAELVGWSYDLLTADGRRVFARLGVFAGPFTASMATAVAGDGDETDDVLDELVGSSMVVADTSGDTTWYRLLHPIRAVALERLRSSGELDEIRSRFVDHIVRLAVDIIGRAASGWSAATLGELLALYDNVATSLRWTTDHDDDARRSLTLLAVLWGVIHQAHTAEVGRLGEAVLARWPQPDEPLWADAAATVATCRYLVGDVDRAVDLATATLEHVGNSPFAPITLRRVLAQSARSLGRTDVAADMFAEAADLAARADLHGLAMEMRAGHAVLLAELGDVDRALALLDSVHDEADERGAPVNRVWAAACRGVALLRRDAEAAKPAIADALEAARGIGYPAGTTFGLRALASAHLALGEVDAAAARLDELLDELLGAGGLDDLRVALDLTAAVALDRSHAGWADLAVTAAALPITTIASPVESELFDRAAPTGTVLSVRDAYRLAREVLAAPAPDHVAAPDGADGPAICGEGDVWRIEYDGATVRLQRSKGLADLARLLASPGREVSCLDLMGSPSTGSSSEAELLDATARRQYEQRVRDLQADIEAADADHDLARAERLRVELDAIVDELTGALGLGGRSRRTSSDAERARSAVTQRIRSALRRIDGAHPSLGSHLRSTIQTGLFCSYRPDGAGENRRWTIDV